MLVDQRTQAKLIVDVAWRRRWWILVPTAAGLAASIFLASTLPKIYRASTTILVMRQSIPEDIVHTTVTTRVEERIRSLKIQVKSRRYLEEVVKELGMAPANAGEGEIERACMRLSSNIDLDWDKQGLSWFNITVDDGDAKRAADIANRLAELFIDQNSALREAQAKGTVETVEGWLETTEKELRKRDAELARYKAQNLYELPDQQAATLQLLNSAQSRIQQLTADIQLRSERLATARAEDKARRAATGSNDGPAVGDDPDARTFAQMQRELQDLLTNYTEENPLVRRKREQLAQFAANHPAVTPQPVGEGERAVSRSPEMARLEGEIRTLEADREREQRNVDTLRRRIENMPLRQQELATLTRDYETLQHQYDANFAQKEKAIRAQDIEAAKKGEQFQIQDRARPPVAPSEPNVPQIVMLGLLGGLGLGVGLASLLEFIDNTVRNEEEFAHRYPELPILGSIPNLDAETDLSSGFLSRVTRSKGAAVALLLGTLAAHDILGAGGPFA
jgi:polysaccharide chain length determinant protein (PEP-CTERM system associated)